jgi:hypothetical protein
MATTNETVQITPSPRILKVLAEIEFAPWQCLAELIDNAFDEFIDIDRIDSLERREALRVDVTLPGDAAGSVIVRDNGRGMTLDQVKDAVRAGFSSNDPFGKLGLFGMGFNVSTARLGDVTTFLSTKAGDAAWVGVQIDVTNMADDFEVPVVRLEKEDPDEHGTRIEITRLNPSGRYFNRPGNRTRVRRQLGAIYSHLLAERGYQLAVDDIDVEAWRHCVWSRERSVPYSGERVPAIIDIDEPLTPVSACRACGALQEDDGDRCSTCGSDDLVLRERRVHGWLGIARELSPKEYGIDFLRNGRKILRFDKDLFVWSDPDDPAGAAEVEYPTELPANMGRIVGEIHLDHVPVRYTKDGFDTADRSWRHAVRVIRGETALRPRKAKAAGDDPNESPLAKLFSAYRRNDPGTRSLVAGDGKKKRDTSGWVELFHEGEPDYQTDEKWWEAVLEHERVKKAAADAEKRAREGARESEQDPTDEFSSPPPSTDGSDEGDEPSVDAEPELSFADRVERLVTNGRPMPELRAEYAARGVPGQPVPLDAVVVAPGAQVLDENGIRTPVLLYGRPRGAFMALVDLGHPLFQNFDDDPADLVLMALAQQMLVRRDATVPIAAVFAELKDRYLASRAIDAARLQPEANQLLADIQERMVDCVAEQPSRPWDRALAEHERALTAERIARVLRTDDSESVIASGGYLPIMPASAVPRVVQEWPEAFMDGRLFTAPYANLEAGPAEQVLAQLLSYLNDAAWLASSATGSRDEMARARFSLQLLPAELA